MFGLDTLFDFDKTENWTLLSGLPRWHFFPAPGRLRGSQTEGMKTGHASIDMALKKTTAIGRTE